MYITIVMTSTSAGAVTFLLPVYAEELGAGYVQLGLLGAVGSLAYTVMTLVSGALLDRFNRLRLYLIFCTLVTIVVLAFYLAAQISDLIILRGAMGCVSAMFWVTASTLIAEMSPPEKLTSSIGRYNISWILGFIIGPFFGGIISESLGFRIFFIIISTLAATSVVIISRRIHYVGPMDRPRRHVLDLSALRGLCFAFLTLMPYCVVLGVYMAILPGYMRGLGISSAIIGLLLTMTNGVRGLGFLNVRRFTDWGEKKSLGVASCLTGAALFLVTLASSTWEFVVPLAMFGLAGGIITPLMLNYIAHRTRQEALGTTMGLHEAVYGIGMLLGPMVGGFIAEVFQPSTLYLGLALTSLAILPLSHFLD